MKVLPFSVMRAAACVWCALLMGTAAQEAPQRPEGVAETPWRLMTPAQRDAVADGMRLEAAALRALDQGRFKDARIEAGKALTALMSGLGADHPLSLDVRRTLAGCAEGLGEYLEAQSILRLMLLLEDSAATPDRRRRANACYLLAKALASGVQRRPKEYQPLLLLQARLYALRAVNGLRPPPGAVSTPAEEAACRPMQDLLAGLEAQIKTLPLEVREPPGHSKKTPEPSMTGQTPLSEAQTQAMTGMDHEVVEIMYRFDQDHDSQAALQALHAIQERYFQLLGKEGPLALARRSRVARMLCDAGSRDEALKELRAVLAVIHRRQQPPDFFTAFVEKSIVLVMRPEAGDTAGLREAELLLRDVLAIEDKVLPPLHTALFQTRALLINTLKAEDKVSGAMREFDRLMKAQQAASGVNDWAALETMRQSAMYCSPVPLLAAEGLVEVMSLYDTASHTNEDLRLAACHDLAGCLMRDKRPDEAHVMALRAWHGREEAFGTNDPRTAESLKLAREITSALASRLQSGLIAGPPKRDASGARTGPDPVKVLDAAVAKWRAMRLDELAELAAKGDGGAQLELASRYAGGEGVKQDLEVS
ncbi:MAG: hypothetical protein JWO94_3174, partial [Verrucomicrobiaceae bacterium]|nr:hypothetical protein [Verrucomicrobiaceae bacterium]